jgi:hypothetical protein
VVVERDNEIRLLEGEVPNHESGHAVPLRRNPGPPAALKLP